MPATEPASQPSASISWVSARPLLDYDNDGAEDLIISNGHVMRHPPSPQTLAQRPVLLRNLARPGRPDPAARFEDVSAKAGPYFQGQHRGRGLAVGDLDNDGKLDVVLNHCDEPTVVLRNTVDNGNHWLGVELRGNPYRDAVGARLTLEAGERRLVRAVKGGVQLFVFQRPSGGVRSRFGFPDRPTDSALAFRPYADLGGNDAGRGSLLDARRGRVAASFSAPRSRPLTSFLPAENAERGEKDKGNKALLSFLRALGVHCGERAA